jgi:hypothetical protein
MDSFARRWGSRAGAVVFGLVLGIGLLEGGRRVAALSVGPRALAPVAEGGQRTILCLGDSHTYGVLYTAEQSYPGHLQALLDLRAPSRYRVLNLGLPGMNSAEIAARLPGSIGTAPMPWSSPAGSTTCGT